MQKKIKYLTILLLLPLFTIVNAQKDEKREYTEQEKKTIVKDFLALVNESRDRVDRLQERGALKEIPYEQEEKLVVEAEQMAKLIEEGHYVSPAKLKELQTALKEIPNPNPERTGEQRTLERTKSGEQRITNRRERWDSSLERYEGVMRRGEEAVKNNRQRISEARKKLEEDRRSGKLSERDFSEKEQKIRQAEQRINELEQKLQEERQKVDKIRNRINNRETRQE